jgi:thiol-disulfide isomerase/thioredoxin/protocatechuate 3,4-dioxygenase beta subunit
MHLWRDKSAQRQIAVTMGRPSAPRSNGRLGLFSLLALLLPLVWSIALPSQALATTPQDAPPQTEPPKSDQPEGENADQAGAKQPTVLVLQGQVTDNIGRGHQGVAVTLHRWLPGDKKGELLGTATTDEIGDFRVLLPAAVEGKAIATLSYPGREPHVETVTLRKDGPPFLGLELKGALKFTGTVRDIMTEKPVAGVAVTLESDAQNWEATTDEEGRYLLEGLVPCEGGITFIAEGFGRETREIQITLDEGENPADPIGPFDVMLKPERVVKLKIRNEVDQPIPRAMVEMYDEPRDDYRSFATDKQGELTIHSIHFDTETLSLRLTHEAHVASAGFDRTIELPRQPLTSEHVLEMSRAGRIEGTILQRGSRAPVNGARIVTGESTNAITARAWADYEGKYTINSVPPGKAVVTVHASDFAPELGVVDVVPGGVAKLDLFLGKPRIIEGTVRNEDGQPVPGAYVFTAGWRDYETLGLRTNTDAEGNFVLGGLPGDAFELSVIVGRSEPVTEVVHPTAGAKVEFVVANAPEAGAGGLNQRPQPGQPAPPIKVTTLEGKELTSEDLKNKIVFVQFWATWCPPCVAEIPHVAEVYKEFGDHDRFALIGISLDQNEDLLRQFLSKNKVNWPQVNGAKSGAIAMADAYGVDAIPALFLIGPDGKILRTDLRGPGMADKVRSALEKLPETP